MRRSLPQTEGGLVMITDPNCKLRWISHKLPRRGPSVPCSAASLNIINFHPAYALNMNYSAKRLINSTRARRDSAVWQGPEGVKWIMDRSWSSGREKRKVISGWKGRKVINPRSQMTFLNCKSNVHILPTEVILYGLRASRFAPVLIKIPLRSGSEWSSVDTFPAILCLSLIYGARHPPSSKHRTPHWSICPIN